MDVLIIVALIGAIPLTAGVVVTLILGLRKINEGLTNIHIQMNSRMDELLEAARAASHALGRAEGIGEERTEQRERIADAAETAAAAIDHDILAGAVDVAVAGVAAAASEAATSKAEGRVDNNPT